MTTTSGTSGTSGTSAPSGSGGSRQAPMHCPYCADEDLRPEPEPHGAWRCTACLRVFVVRFVGIAPSPARTGVPR